jgi:cytochrome c oxidase assembly protein subunit 15
VQVSLPLRRLLGVTFALLVVQVALGGWVSTNYAVLACSEFPMCQNSWWPDMNFAQGFELWRALGFTADGQHISFSALTAIHYVHRLMAYVVLLLLGWLAWRMRDVPAWRQPARWLAVLTLLQFVTGLSNVVLDWPLLAAVLHTGGAAALVVVLTWAQALVWVRPAAADASSLPVSRLAA